MKILSEKKIEAQAYFISQKYKTPEDIQKEINLLHASMIEAKSILEKEIYPTCPASVSGQSNNCRCQLHPKWKEVFDVIDPTTRKINSLYYKVQQERNKIHIEYVDMMRKVQEAKIKYHNRNYK